MRAVTGIELGGDSCVVARVRTEHETVRVSALHGLFEADWSSESTLGENLRQARRSKGFPRRAHVVAWGLHEGAALTDLATKAALAPIIDAGFSVVAVISPPEALAVLARQRPRGAEREGAAWLSVNRHGAAIAVVHDGDLWYSRVFDWNYRPATTVREELLRRYSLVAHLGPELRHAFDVVRRDRRARIETVVTCGDLPDLRSLTMPLIEELDIEVETLDTLEGLEIVAPAKVEAVIEKAPAMRLACAAALAKPAARRSFLRPWAAAAIAAALLVWAGTWYVGTRGSTPPAQLQAGASLPAATGGGRPAAPQRVQVKPVPPRAASNERPPDANVPAATTGRQDAPVSMDRPRPPAARQMPPVVTEHARVRSAPRPAPVPLKAPLPVVNSILVSPDRRLAVVDGEIVHEGAQVGPRVLIRIEPGALLFREPSGYEVRVPIRRKFGPQAERESGI
jgi:hypothetical protein